MSRERSCAPDEVPCATCGGVAKRATWGHGVEIAYRCRDCHAGGHIVILDEEIRQGGVFERLENYATRGARV